MSEPQPVLLLARALGPGGSEHQMVNTARSLDRSLFAPHVCAFHTDWFLPPELAAMNFPVFHLPIRSYRSLFAIRGARKLVRYMKDMKIVLVHSWDYPLNVFAAPLARTIGIPVVLTSQRSDRRLVPEPYRSMLRITDRLVDGIVVDSESLVRHMIDEERAPRSLVHRCPNGIDTSRFSPHLGPRPPQLNGASVVVGVVCTLRPVKNLQLLMRAFARVRDLRSGLRLVIIGSGPELAALMKLKASLGLDDECCIFVPATREVPYWMRAIDIFVLPSYSEAFSNALMEAMATGCCALAAAVDGNTELIRGGETGLLFQNRSVESLVAQLRAAIVNNELRKRLGEAAVRFIRSRFSFEVSAQHMGEIYLTLLKQRQVE